VCRSRDVGQGASSLVTLRSREIHVVKMEGKFISLLNVEESGVTAPTYFVSTVDGAQ
jgi:EAL domain-containing protein (putative c-di-GMP-specific phosphodiesterase class I)